MAKRKTSPLPWDVEDQIQKLLSPDGRQPDRADGGLKLLPKMKCASGLGFSMQASAFHYCSPRNDKGPWESVEIGFPTKRVAEFMPFMDGSDSKPTDTVYGWVPINVVAYVVAKNGGFV